MIRRMYRLDQTTFEPTGEVVEVEWDRPAVIMMDELPRQAAISRLRDFGADIELDRDRREFDGEHVSRKSTARNLTRGKTTEQITRELRPKPSDPAWYRPRSASA